MKKNNTKREGEEEDEEGENETKRGKGAKQRTARKT